MMQIRRADISDYEPIWAIFSDIISKGDTYVFDPGTPKSHLKIHWFADEMTTFVAEQNGRIAGTYIIKPNLPGLGDHIANCSYMVSQDVQGKGVGTAMCKHSIRFATEQGYRGMQFNVVVSTNEAAIHLWKKIGFKIIGVTPKGFRHPMLGPVDTFIMFKDLDNKL